MTRQEAIAELNVLHERLSNPKDCEDGCYSWEDGRYVEAIGMAIEALSQPIVCKDYCIDDNHIYCSPKMADMVYEALQAKSKTGKWVIKQGKYCGVELKEFFCDKCGTRGALRRVFSDPEPLPNYCSNCGADMRVKNDDERGE